MATNGNDIIFGTAGNNTLDALAGNDTVYALAGADTLIGNLGNDVLNGGLGNDTLNGGTGNDTADYSSGVVDPPGPVGPQTVTGATSGVTVNLNVQGVAQNTGGAGSDTLVSIENVFGTLFNDTLTGNGANNVFSGLAGNDTLLGGNGHDTLNGGSGNDLLNGGAGNDTASYSAATASVTVNLDVQGVAQNTGGAGSDTLVSIENLTGSKFNDLLIAAFVENSTLNGGAGNDVLLSDHSFNFTLNGDGGNDVVSSDTGFGTLNGGDGNDVLSAFDGVYSLNGGAGNDELSVASFFDDDFMLNGGAGADLLHSFVDPEFDSATVIFDYNAVSDSPAGVGKDKIEGFDGEGAAVGTQIDLTTIDARPSVAGNQAFIWDGPFTEGHLRYLGGVLQGNLDADAAAEFAIQLVGSPTLSIGGAGTDILL